MGKIFITGGTGFIGSHLCAHLVQQGHELTLLVRDKKNAANTSEVQTQDLSQHHKRPALPSSAKRIVGELLQPETYCQAMKGCDAVIHLAADYRVGLPNQAKERQKMYESNVQGTLAIAQAVKHMAIPRLIYASTTAAFGETFGLFPDESALHNSIFRCYYEETKHIAHVLLKQRQEEGLPVVMAILSGVFGQGDEASVTQAMRDFLNNKLPALPDSTSRFQLCHVSHICKAFELLLNHPEPERAYLFTGQDFSMREIMDTLALVSEKTAPKKIPLNMLKLPAQGMDFLSRFGLKFPLSKEVLHILDGSTYMYSSEKAKSNLGWSCGQPLEELKAHMRDVMEEEKQFQAK